MTAACPTDETLAAFVDGSVDHDGRRIVIDHMAGCGLCRSTVITASELSAAEGTESKRTRFGKAKWPLLAAAAAIVIAAVLLPSLRRDPVERVFAVAAKFPLRAGIGRLSGELPYKPAPEPFRSGVPTREAGVEMYHLAGEMQNTNNWHARGLTYLYVEENLTRAVDALARAYQQATPENRAAIATDYATALLARGDTADLQQAAKAVEGINTPAALWNRAIALEYLGEDQEALAAFEAFLAVETDPQWKREAQQRVAGLQRNP